MESKAKVTVYTFGAQLGVNSNRKSNAAENCPVLVDKVPPGSVIL